MKLALGTVQFGMDYGINNKEGKVTKEEVFRILNFALENNIDVLDTATAYNCEETLGEYTNINKFKIISKTSENIEIKNSLKKLKQKKIYGYLLHDFSKFSNTLWQEMLNLKKEGVVEKIGLSLYYPKELDFLLENKINFDILQIPYNIFDRRFEKYFSKLKEKQIEIHVRSVFLQGLFFKKEIPPFFSKVKDKIINIQKLAIKNNTKISSICINFAASNNFIDKVIIGVDSLNNLEENVNYDCEINGLEDFQVDDENILIPSKWRLE